MKRHSCLGLVNLISEAIVKTERCEEIDILKKGKILSLLQVVLEIVQGSRGLLSIEQRITGNISGNIIVASNFYMGYLSEDN